VACIAVNTAGLGESDARAAVAGAEQDTELPADDPVRFGADKLLDAVLTALGTEVMRTEAVQAER
jgi:uncharacterized NAD-dependent epimerase/dehydratase family protein